MINLSKKPIYPDEHQKIVGLDLLRAFAISFVFLYHYSGIFQHPAWIRDLTGFGWTGVDLFFVLSGYLISSQLFKEIITQRRILYRQFFLKRIFRIIPGYLFIVAIYFLLPGFREREAPAPLWKFLTFTQNLGLDLRTQGTFSHAWSLCIEEQFYLFLPLLLGLLLYFRAQSKGALVLLFFFLAGIAARLFAWQVYVIPHGHNNDFIIYWYKWIYYPTYARLDGLLVGVTIAAISNFRPQLMKRILARPILLIVGALFVLTTAYLLCEDQDSFWASIAGFPLIAIGYGLLLMSVLRWKVESWRWMIRPIIFIATLSYAIYLSHKIVIHLTQEQLGRLGIDKTGNLMLVCCITASIVVAWGMHRLIERPALFARKWLLNRID